MTRDEVLKEICELDSAMSAPLSEAELANGWTPRSQQATLALLREIAGALRTGGNLPGLSMGRGLDHWGIEGGELFEKACKLSNHLRQMASGRTS